MLNNQSSDTCNVIKYYDLVILHDWDVSYEKFGGLPTVVAFWEN